jgi:glucosamine--fructose-6-phosphate aminotransferase (isomerizing)
MDADGFLTDIERTPETLRSLADAIEAIGADRLPFDRLPSDVGRILLLGMGSSAYAAGVAAARMRSYGIDAVAELASSDLLPPASSGTLVVAVSAGGSSVETLAAARTFAGRATVVTVTEKPDSALGRAADLVVPLLAGPEVGGVACRTYRHTVAVLLALGAYVSGRPLGPVASTCRLAADATADLLDRRTDWLPDVADLLAGADGSWVVAPSRRLASAQQSALMVREGPRRPCHAAETGDWSHVDVYLTKTLDYRMLLLPGSAYEPELLRWTAERRSTVVCVGADVAGAAATVRYAHDDQDDVRLLAETTVAELVAHRWWAAQS